MFNTNIFWLVLALDLVTTFAALRQQGLVEGNPVARMLMSDAGRVVYIALRVIFTVLCVRYAQDVVTRAGGFWPLYGYSLFFAAVIVNNVKQIAKGRNP